MITQWRLGIRAGNCWSVHDNEEHTQDLYGIAARCFFFFKQKTAYEIVNAKMSDLIRRQVVRTGYLPEEFVIYAFGGAGPVHASGFAAELGIKQIYIFATSPVFSAFGAAAADVIRTRVMSCQYILPADPAVINKRLDAME